MCEKVGGSGSRPGYLATSCCGEEHLSPFCPTCGKRLKNIGTLHGLLAHCRVGLSCAQKAYDRAVEARKRWTDNNKGERTLRKRQKRLEKWQGWVDELEQVLADPCSK